jgi:hypothetical protein
MGGMVLVVRLCGDAIGMGGKERREIGPTGCGWRETGVLGVCTLELVRVIRLDRWDGFGRMMRDEQGKRDIASGYG